MNWKKTLAVLASLTIAVGSLGGCANKAESSSSSSSASSGSTAKPVIKALVGYASGMDYNNYPASKYLEQKTGYKIQYDMLPADNPNDKINAIVASGTSYDWIYIQDKTEYANLAQQGALTDLQPLAKQYGSNLSSNIDPALFDISTINNTYYAIPCMSPTGRKDTGNVANGIVIRQDLLSKLGLSMPKTIDDFMNMLKAVKAKYPNMIPLTTDNTVPLNTSGVGGAFGITTAWSVSGGKLVPDVEQPGFKSYIDFLRDLYGNGLLDKEAPTNTTATAEEKFTSGKAFAFVDGWYDIPTLMTTIAKTQPSAKIKYMAPVSGQFGAASELAPSINAIGGFSVIPQSSKHAVDVIKYFNAQLDAATFKGAVLGEENVDYTVKDGSYYPVLPAFFNDRGNANDFIAAATKDYPSYWLCRVHKDDNLYEGWKELNIDYGDTAIVDPTADLPCSIYSSVANDQLTLTTLKNQFIIQSIAGQYSDATYNSFLAKWKAQGGDNLVKTLNDWYASKK